MTETTVSRDLQDQILSAIRKGHAVTLDAFKVAVDRAAPVTSKLPAVSVSFPEKLTFTDKVPFGDKIPSRESVVTGVREFASEILSEQKKFNGEFRKTASALRSAPAPAKKA